LITVSIFDKVSFAIIMILVHSYTRSLRPNVSCKNFKIENNGVKIIKNVKKAKIFTTWVSIRTVEIRSNDSFSEEQGSCTQYGPTSRIFDTLFTFAEYLLLTSSLTRVKNGSTEVVAGVAAPVWIAAEAERARDYSAAALFPLAFV